MKKILLIPTLTLLLIVGCSNQNSVNNNKSNDLSTDTEANVDVNPEFVKGSYAIFDIGIVLENPYDVYKAIDVLMKIQPFAFDDANLQYYYSKQGSAIVKVYDQLLRMIITMNNLSINISEFDNMLSVGSDYYVEECKAKSQQDGTYFNEYKCLRDFVLNDLSRLTEKFLGQKLDLSPYNIDSIDTPNYFYSGLRKQKQELKAKQDNSNNTQYMDNPNSAKPDEFEANDGEPMEYVPSEEEREEMEREEEYNSSQESPYVKGQQLIVTSEKANIRKEPYLEGKVVGYWIKDDIVTVYDYIFYEERWWIKTDPDKEWWVSERNLKVID